LPDKKRWRREEEAAVARNDDRSPDRGEDREGNVELLDRPSASRSSAARMEKVRRLRELIARGEYFVPAAELAEKIAAAMWGRGPLQQ
jgi:anti-sigma28 factor (negative regulator of flagellin synthesis)